LGHLGEQIREYVGDGTAFGLRVDYSFEGPQPLGTGGALLRALPLLGGEFIQTYGDSYLDLEYGEIEAAWRRTSAPALMTVLRNVGRWGSSNVSVEGLSVTRYQKNVRDPAAYYIEFGLNFFRTEVFRRYAVGHAFDLGELHAALARDGLLAAQEVNVRFYEIGTAEGLRDCEAHIRAKTPWRS
jgi:NDP-sugar pyrophosphorylase family protein